MISGKTIQRRWHSQFLLTNYISSFHVRNIFGVYIDLSKAFDMENYHILHEYLYNYGIRGVALNWINNYLQDHSQYVQYNNINYNNGLIQLGVSLGSIIVFSIY